MTKAKATHLHPGDLRGYAKLAVDATAGITDLVEAMHSTIASPLGRKKREDPDRTDGITGLVYRSIGGMTQLVGSGLDAMLGMLPPMLNMGVSSPERDSVIAALNGVLGDYLSATMNPLAITMKLRSGGKNLELSKPALRKTFPTASGKLVVLVHGLCMNDLQWARLEHDHGAMLAEELGYTPVYLNYNSGQHISTNGHELSLLLNKLVAAWPVPVEELVLLGHSMGGLVARSAVLYAQREKQRWVHKLTRMVFLGTPHFGAPLERGGNWVDMILGTTPWSAPFARLGKVRSAGITDLRHSSLMDEAWAGRDRFAHSEAEHPSIPLPENVRCYAIAATTGSKADDLQNRLWGDGLVPLNSALGIHDDAEHSLKFTKARQHVVYDTNHLELLSSQAVAKKLKKWLAN